MWLCGFHKTDLLTLEILKINILHVYYLSTPMIRSGESTQTSEHLLGLYTDSFRQF